MLLPKDKYAAHLNISLRTKKVHIHIHELTFLNWDRRVLHGHMGLKWAAPQTEPPHANQITLLAFVLCVHAQLDPWHYIGRRPNARRRAKVQPGGPPPRTSAPRLHTNHARAEAASFATTPEQLQPRQEVKGANWFLSAAAGPTCWQRRIWPPTQTAAKLLNFSQLWILGLQHQRYQNSIREYFSSA